MATVKNVLCLTSRYMSASPLKVVTLGGAFSLVSTPPILFCLACIVIMQLNLDLPSPILVTPSVSGFNTQTTFDAPPSYDAVSFSSPHSPSSLSLFHSTSSCPCASSSSTTILKALNTLTSPSTRKHAHVLTSLMLNLQAYESLAHNDGAFEQSHPIDLHFSTPLASPYVLLPQGESCTLKVELACPDRLPPSVQLPDARLKYRLCARATTLPVAEPKAWLNSLRHANKMTTSCDLTVVHAVDTEVHQERYSKLWRVWADGLGWLYISITRSIYSIGGSVVCNLNVPNDPTKITNITRLNLSLRQDSYIRSRGCSKSVAK